jgi:hypothetical protein
MTTLLKFIWGLPSQISLQCFNTINGTTPILSRDPISNARQNVLKLFLRRRVSLVSPSPTTALRHVDNLHTFIRSKGSQKPSVNPNGLIMAAFGPVFLAFIPVTNYVTAPNGLVQKAIETLVSLIPGSSIPSDRVIPALSAF